MFVISLRYQPDNLGFTFLFSRIAYNVLIGAVKNLLTHSVSDSPGGLTWMGCGDVDDVGDDAASDGVELGVHLSLAAALGVMEDGGSHHRVDHQQQDQADRRPHRTIHVPPHHPTPASVTPWNVALARWRGWNCRRRRKGLGVLGVGGELQDARISYDLHTVVERHQVLLVLSFAGHLAPSRHILQVF